MQWLSSYVAMCTEQSDGLGSSTQAQAAYDTGALKMTGPTISEYDTVKKNQAHLLMTKHRAQRAATLTAMFPWHRLNPGT